MKRFLGTLAGVLVILIGAALAGLGGLGLAVFGTEGSTSSASTTLRSDEASAAIVADLQGVEVGMPYAHLLGSPTLTVTGTAGESVFVGTGAQSDVDAFLFGVPYDLASRNGTWSTTAVPGVEAEAPDPLSQDFWLERSVGMDAQIELSAQDPPTTLVIMNADGSLGVDTELTLGFRGEYLFAYSVAALSVGIVLIAITVALLVRAGRRRRASKEDVDVAPWSASTVFAPSEGEGQPDAVTADDRSE